MSDAIKVGDHVTIAPLGLIHWLVIWVNTEHQTANLRSGQTDRTRRCVPLSKLKIHTTKEDLPSQPSS